MFEIEVQRAVFVHRNLDGLGYIAGLGGDRNRDRPPDVQEAVASVGTGGHGFLSAVFEPYHRAGKHWPVSPACRLPSRIE